MTREQIENWLTQQGIVNFEITEDLEVNVNGNVDLYARKLTSIPIRFGVVNGSFWCARNKLSSLLHAPHTVRGDFYCHNNGRALYRCPTVVGGSFY